MSNKEWIGVDLDGTLAVYDVWRGDTHIGDPIAPMVDCVKQWLSEGKDVRIFTARVHSGGWLVRNAIISWCEKHLGQELPITCCKDMHMIELWDDRCVQVITNTGIAV
jgi:hypothetical protein